MTYENYKKIKNPLRQTHVEENSMSINISEVRWHANLFDVTDLFTYTLISAPMKNSPGMTAGCLRRRDERQARKI